MDHKRNNHKLSNNLNIFIPMYIHNLNRLNVLKISICESHFRNTEDDNNFQRSLTFILHFYNLHGSTTKSNC